MELLEAKIKKLESQMGVMQFYLNIFNELTKHLLEKLESEEDGTCEEE